MIDHYDVMTSKLYNLDMAKERLTVYLDGAVARALRVSAARRGLKDSQVVEEALREYVSGPEFDRLILETVRTTFPEHEHERFAEHYRGILTAWSRDQCPS